MTHVEKIRVKHESRADLTPSGGVMGKAVILMGSKSDMEYCKKIGEILEVLGVEYSMRIASAHKVPEKVMKVVKENSDSKTVFITVAGRSNALSGFVDAGTQCPVIASPPYSDKFSGMDILSSLRMPSGVCPMTVLGAEQAALAAAKILGIVDEELKKRIKSYQEEKRVEIDKADKEIDNG